MGETTETTSTPEAETARICQEFIRFDTSNYSSGEAEGERAAAEHVAELIQEVGLETQYFESAPGRANVFTRLEGSDPTADALLVHGHLDVVPAMAQDWSVDPFAGELKDGMIWGRGAVDMKDMDAMMLSVLRHMRRTGAVPRRDIVFGFFADEEAGMRYGSKYMVHEHPEVFEGVTDAISEVGGFSASIGGRRAYLLQTAEKGLLWLKLHAQGQAGHGSGLHEDNAVTHLSRAMANIGQYTWPVELTKTTRAFLDQVTELTGVEFDPQNPQQLLRELGAVSRFVGATLQNTSNPTVLEGGYKTNVIPGSAQGAVDVRFLPEQKEHVLATLQELAGDKVRIEAEFEDIALEVPFSGTVVDAMVDALEAEDPDAVVLPYMLGAGTDNKSLSTLGITGYGFVPLQLPDELDFTGMFHGVDERVPVASLEFGSRVLDRLLRTY
ncbi:M20/M25/M40 family metallo-hydrolase [Kocuria rhizophila]|uniref:M20/M25/M40 family metallo-hydrolase n=1 Tax=Kocuria rhizophila TaxID=72000 RepID=UPI000F53E2FE|nr:M20/M25/M40 family metallo-hydrolase [Kocuria rhizophila]MXN61559.1 M20/M25/M40 family metallo-hydrolase [Bacillus sp. BGMRC0062]